MPELPEAEAARKRIADGVLDRRIEGITLGEVSHVELPSEAEREAMVGSAFTRTHRHGKYIFVGAEGAPWMHIHLGMAGSIRVLTAEDETPKHTRFTVEFEDGTRLHFRDPRKFGLIRMVDDVEQFVSDKKLGPDALTIGDNAFAQNVGKTRGAVKSALLSQQKLAGVGNLWADEALYRTGIHPEVQPCDLDAAEIGALHRSVLDVLRGVVKTNATYSKLPQDWLIHHREDGDACTRCDGRITKKTVGGRTSYYCPDHQVGA